MKRRGLGVCGGGGWTQLSQYLNRHTYTPCIQIKDKGRFISLIIIIGEQKETAWIRTNPWTDWLTSMLHTYLHKRSLSRRMLERIHTVYLKSILAHLNRQQVFPKLNSGKITDLEIKLQNNYGTKNESKNGNKQRSLVTRWAGPTCIWLQAFKRWQAGGRTEEENEKRIVNLKLQCGCRRVNKAVSTVRPLCSSTAPMDGSSHWRFSSQLLKVMTSGDDIPYQNVYR